MSTEVGKQSIKVQNGLIKTFIENIDSLSLVKVPFKQSLSEFKENLVDAHKSFMDTYHSLEDSYFVRDEEGNFALVDSSIDANNYSNRVLLDELILEDFSKDLSDLINEVTEVAKPTKLVNLDLTIYNSIMDRKETIGDFLDQSTEIDSTQLSLIKSCLCK